MPGPTIPAPQFPTAVTRASQAWAGLNFAWNVAKLLFARPLEVEVKSTPYTPSTWAALPAPVYLYDNDGNSYVFDAIPRLEHATTLRLTEHPIQTGASIVDHSFQLPERLTFEVGMSDVMDSYYKGQWADGDMKSVSAYEKLKELQYGRLPLTVITRLNTYSNMIIEQVHAIEDRRTLNGLRATVTMRQIFVAEVSTVRVSARPSTTANGPTRKMQPSPVSGSTGSALAEMGF